MARAYELYLICRNVELVSVEIARSKTRTELVTSPWTTGLSQFPEAGGVLDQPFVVMEFFTQFLAGDRTASMNKLK